MASALTFEDSNTSQDSKGCNASGAEGYGSTRGNGANDKGGISHAGQGHKGEGSNKHVHAVAKKNMLYAGCLVSYWIFLR